MSKYYVAFVFSLIATSGQVAVSGEIVFAETEDIQLVSIEQPSPGDGLMATMIQARTIDPTASVVTLTNLRISNVHNVWGDSNLFFPEYAARPDICDSIICDFAYHSAWVPYDSHLAIGQTMVAGGAGNSYEGIIETNDGTGSIALPDFVPVHSSVVPALPGFGDLFMADPTDSFFLTSEASGHVVDIAYVVGDSAKNSPVTISIGLQGDLGTFGTEYSAQIGYDEPIAVPFVPEPVGSWPLIFATLAVFQWTRNSSLGNSSLGNSKLGTPTYSDLD